MNKAKCFFILPLLISLGVSSPVFAESEFQPEAPSTQTERPNRAPDTEFAEPEVEVEIKKEIKEEVKPVENPAVTEQTTTVKPVIQKETETVEQAEIVEETKEEVVEKPEKEEVIEVPEMGEVKNAARKTYREIVIKTLAIAATAMVLIVTLFVHEIRVLKNRKKPANLEDVEISAAAVKIAMQQEKEEEKVTETIEVKKSIEASDLHKPLI